MSVVKVIELLAEGSTMEDAVESALAEASKTIRNISGIDQQTYGHARAHCNGSAWEGGARETDGSTFACRISWTGTE